MPGHDLSARGNVAKVDKMEPLWSRAVATGGNP